MPTKKNIVHSDFKPGNIFINEASDEVKVLDFGIASIVQKRQEEVTVFDARELGALTPGYASLEMLQGQSADPRDDVYALACISFELLTGKHPYGTLPANKALELGLQPKPVNGLSRRRWRILRQGLALRQVDRIPSTETFLAGLGKRSRQFPWRATMALLIGSTLAVASYFKPDRMDWSPVTGSIDFPLRKPVDSDAAPAISSPKSARGESQPDAIGANRLSTAPIENPSPVGSQAGLSPTTGGELRQRVDIPRKKSSAKESGTPVQDVNHSTTETRQTTQRK